MKKILLLTVFSCFLYCASAQFVYKIKADSLLVTNDSCTAELNLENSTKQIKGFLYNYGNGRTRFQKGLIKIDSVTYLVGADTLKLAAADASNAWKLTGNAGTNAATNFLGTTDSNKLVIKTKNLQRASIWEDGTFNIASTDTTSKPLFRVYPNGDFTVKATNNLTGNVFGPNNGLRYTSKYGILEVGTNNNFDTTVSASCCGSLAKSAIVINSDFLSTFRGTLHGSIIVGDNHLIDTFGYVIWSSLAGERHRIYGGVNTSVFSGWGNVVDKGAEIKQSIVTGGSNQISKPFVWGMMGGAVHVTADSSLGSLVSGLANKFGGTGQLVAGGYLTNRTPFGTTLGHNNVDFASLNYKGWLTTISNIPDLNKYPIFAIGNSRYYADPAFKSNALTVLFNGRTQINTTGFDTNLPETAVTPKAAFEVVSTNSGVLLPKLTNAQRNSIISTDLHNGLLLYNTDSSAFQYYNGSIWKSIGSGSSTGGGGNVTKVGVPINNQLGIWTGDGTIKGDPNLIFNGTNLSLLANAPVLSFGNTTSTQTASPAIINMGATYADDNQSYKAKLQLYYDANEPNTYAIGVSQQNLNYFAGTGASHRWYVDNAEKMILSPAGNLSMPSLQVTTMPNGGLTTDSVVVIRSDGTTRKRNAASFGSSSGWGLTGNATTNSGTNFLGTSDNISLRIRTNNLPRAVIDSTGKVGINTAAPSFQLDVSGDARVSTLPFLANRDTVLTYDPVSKQIKATLPTVPGTLLAVRVLTTGTSYTPTTGTKAIFVEMAGGGGGGGGVTGVAASIGAGGGGGSGSYLTKYITGITAGPFTYAIGAAGTAGAATGGTGGSGGNTTLTIGATTYTAPGGSGGIGQTAGTAAAIILGGNGGAAGTNGDVNGAGQSGDRGFRLSGTVGSGGNGGSSIFGGGGNARNTAGVGNAGTAFGAGGGGALSTAASTTQIGGVGRAGVIIIYEYR